MKTIFYTKSINTLLNSNMRINVMQNNNQTSFELNLKKVRDFPSVYLFSFETIYMVVTDVVFIAIAAL